MKIGTPLVQESLCQKS